MKRLGAAILFFCFLFGCASENMEESTALKLRNQLLSAEGCAFDAKITADYGDTYCTFSMKCQFNSSGDMIFTVTEPESISQITGRVAQSEGHLTFDDKVLLFQMLIDGQLTPVCAPWLLYRTLLGGIIRGAGNSADGTQVIYDDVFSGESFQMYLRLDKNGLPSESEFVWQGRRILSVYVGNFAIL